MKFSQIITKKKKVRRNKFLIGMLIGVHASSIVNSGYPGNFKPVYLFVYLFIYFFNEKISRPQKHVTSENQLTKQK